ncbi:hypothetical protein D3C75_681000 [compost metagenome]
MSKKITNFRKRPVPVEALQWKDNQREMYDFITGDTEGYMQYSGEYFRIDHEKVRGGLHIKTNVSYYTPVPFEYYVIKDAYGQFTVMPPEEFKRTHIKIHNLDKEKVAEKKSDRNEDLQKMKKIIKIFNMQGVTETMLDIFSEYWEKDSKLTIQDFIEMAEAEMECWEPN